MNSRFLNYFSYSKDLLSSIFLIAPFMLLYESLCYILFNGKDYEIRNAADAIIRNYFYIYGEVSQLYYILILCLSIVLYITYNYQKYENYSFSLQYYFIMLFESLFYSLLLIVIINGVSIFTTVADYNYNNYFINFYSSLGAGLWEEVFFRFIIYTLIYKVLNSLSLSKIYSIFFAVVLSSILFSVFHYTGNLGEVFYIKTFIIRFVAGVLLCLIYIKRGLGITCITHLSYDVLLFSIPLL